MKKERIYLYVKQNELGVMGVYDQDGREVAGVRAVTLRHAMDECASFTLDAIDYAGGNAAWAPSAITRKQNAG